MSDNNFKVLNSIRTILLHVRKITKNRALIEHINWFNDVIKFFESYKDNPTYTKNLIINNIALINGYTDNISAKNIYDALAEIDQIINIQNINNTVVSEWINFLIDEYDTPLSKIDLSLDSYSKTPGNDPSEETKSTTSEGTGSQSLILEKNDPSEETRSPTNNPSKRTKIQHLILGNDPAKDKPTASILRVVAIVLLVIVAVLGIIFGIGMIIAFIYAIRSEEREEKWSTQRVLGRTLLSFGYVAMYWSKYGIW